MRRAKVSCRAEGTVSDKEMLGGGVREGVVNTAEYLLVEQHDGGKISTKASYIPVYQCSNNVVRICLELWRQGDGE